MYNTNVNETVEKNNLSKFICIQKLLCDNKIIKKIRNNEISKA